MAVDLEKGEVNIKSFLIITGVVISAVAGFFWQVVIPIRDVQARVVDIQVTQQQEHDNYAVLDRRVTALEKK